MIVNKDEIQELNSKVDYLINRFEELVVRDVSLPLKSEVDIEIDDTVDINGAAKIVNRSTSTLYTRCSENTIPFFRDPGNRISFSKRQLLDWMKSDQPYSETKTSTSKMCKNRSRFSKK